LPSRYPSGFRDSLDLPPWSLPNIHQLSLVSSSQTDPFDMQHLTCETVFLDSVFLIISQLRHTALHHHPLIQNWLFTCLMASSILVSKLTSSPSRSSIIFSLSRGLIPWNIDIRCLEVFGV